MNGVVSPTPDGFELTTEEVFPNCPKYVQQRSFERVVDETASRRLTGDGLTPDHREWMRSTDTFFIGSYHLETGADASHRGGDPGFVDVEGDTVAYPDYPGNSMFWTLQITGRADVVWDEARVDAYEGAERLVEITAERTVELPDGNPLRWTIEERSPFNP